MEIDPIIFFKPNKVLIDHHAIYKWDRSSHRAVGTSFGTIKNTLKRQNFKWKSIQSFFSSLTKF